MIIKAFLTKVAVEGFDIGVLVGLARLDEKQLNTPGICPVQHSSTVEFFPVICPDRFG